MVTLTLDSTFVAAVLLVLAAMKASDVVYDAAMKWQAKKDAKKKGRALSPNEYRRLVIHEAGHALIVRKLFPDALDSVTCWKHERPGCDHLGFVIHHSGLMHSHDDYYKEIVVYYGGYAAECLMFGNGGVGADEDVQNAFEAAKRILSTRAKDGKAPIPWEELLALAPTPEANERFQTDVVDIMTRAYGEATAILNDCRPQIEKVIVAFNTTERLSKRELDDLLGAP